MGVPFRGGFNRSKQHNERCVSSESVANETETPDPLQRKPEGVDVGTLARRRVAAVVRNKSVTVATISVSLRDQRPTRSSIASSPADVEVPVDGEMPVSVGHQQPLKKARLNDRSRRAFGHGSLSASRRPLGQLSFSAVRFSALASYLLARTIQARSCGAGSPLRSQESTFSPARVIDRSIWQCGI